MSEIKIGDTLTETTVRGRPSWDYFYIMLGFALTIGSTVVSMLPLKFPCNIIAFALFAVLTVWAFIESKWLHNKMISLKNSYENKAR
jgi:hypothetical protein